MTLKNSLKTALFGLGTHKFRSALTILGIVIGVTAIILIMSLGKSAQSLIISQVQGLGSRTLVVVPGREPKGPADAAQMFSDSLKERDFVLLKERANAPSVAEVMPLLFGGATGSYRSETYRLTIFGASPLVAKIFDLSPAQGAFFGEEEAKGYSDVVVIGAKIKKELFGASEALGQKIKIQNRTFRIIGILPAKGQVSFYNFDETAIIPYTTAQKYIFGIKYFHRFIIQASSEDKVSQAVREVTTTLRNSHGITDPEKDDFFVETQADIVDRLGVITDVLTLFLASVAAISLVVGGIGIMNIMIVSVTERTREIGLRKAVGATEKDILIQFLLEAVILTLIGGIIGILLGTFFSLISSIILGKVIGFGWQFTFPAQAAILGLIVSVLVGLVFGLYPARRASLKSPIEALRYE